MFDNFNQPCDYCGRGVFQETEPHDEIYGVLHCTHCGVEVNRRDYEDFFSEEDEHFLLDDSY